MHTSIRLTSIVTIAMASLMTSAAFAQTAEPNAGGRATTVTATPTTVTAKSWITEEATGQWRASNMIGLNVYNDDNEKIGGIADFIVDRTGKLEAVVVGAGGFLGIGERDVAVPYEEIKWAFTPVGPVRTSASTAPATTGAVTADAHYAYPDHAVLSMTKDQLKAVPAFKFSR